MRRAALACAAALSAACAGTLSGLVGGRALPELDLGHTERLMVMAPHPDDEVICCAGLMRRVIAAGGRVDIVYFTQGDGYLEGAAFELSPAKLEPELFIAYGEWRRRESLAVLTLLRLSEQNAHFLGFPDGGLREIWESHFSQLRPYESRTTATAHVPYRHSVEPGAPYAGIELQGLVRGLILDLKPTLIALPDPRDQHGDHSATGLFALEAFHDASEAAAAAGIPPARVLTYLVHWPHWPHWPGLSAEPPPPLLPPPDLSEAPIEWSVLRLSEAESADKLHVLHVYKTQVDVMAPFLDSFYRSNELFGTFTDEPPPQGLALSPLAYRKPRPPAP